MHCIAHVFYHILGEYVVFQKSHQRAHSYFTHVKHTSCDDAVSQNSKMYEVHSAILEAASPDNQDEREEVLGGILLLAEATLMSVRLGAGKRKKCMTDATAAAVKSSRMRFSCESRTQRPLRRTGNAR